MFAADHAANLISARCPIYSGLLQTMRRIYRKRSPAQRGALSSAATTIPIMTRFLSNMSKSLNFSRNSGLQSKGQAVAAAEVEEAAVRPRNTNWSSPML
ncbi:hypothetical protein IID62_07890, partial [candidate division KSB1 bacterium]|nr:hypothetical protein [candidate division KSB1 bacterium]